MKLPMRAAAALATVAVLAACAPITVNDLPQPGEVRDGYDVVMQFDNVLNLPQRANVVLDGVKVGQVVGVEVAGDRVDLTARIQPGVVIPADIHAALQQATVLGDIYVALERPAEPELPAPAPALTPGGVVPLAHTTSPTQIEDIIANLANFVASGSIQRAQNAMMDINRVADTSEAPLEDVVAQVHTNLADLADNLDSVNLALSGLTDTSTVLYGRRADMAHWFSPAGMVGFDRVTQVTSRLSVMIPSIGSIYSGGFWLVPMFTTLGDAAGAVQGSKWAVEDEIPGWRKLFTRYFLPQDKYPAINITSIIGPDGQEMSDNVEDVLRILGATP